MASKTYKFSKPATKKETSGGVTYSSGGGVSGGSDPAKQETRVQVFDTQGNKISDTQRFPVQTSEGIQWVNPTQEQAQEAIKAQEAQKEKERQANIVEQQAEIAKEKKDPGVVASKLAVAESVIYGSDKFKALARQRREEIQTQNPEITTQRELTYTTAGGYARLKVSVPDIKPTPKEEPQQIQKEVMQGPQLTPEDQLKTQEYYSKQPQQTISGINDFPEINLKKAPAGVLEARDPFSMAPMLTTKKDIALYSFKQKISEEKNPFKITQAELELIPEYGENVKNIWGKTALVFGGSALITAYETSPVGIGLSLKSKGLAGTLEAYNPGLIVKEGIDILTNPGQPETLTRTTKLGGGLLGGYYGFKSTGAFKDLIVKDIELGNKISFDTKTLIYYEGLPKAKTTFRDTAPKYEEVINLFPEGLKGQPLGYFSIKVEPARGSTQIKSPYFEGITPVSKGTGIVLRRDTIEEIYKDTGITGEEVARQIEKEQGPAYDYINKQIETQKGLVYDDFLIEEQKRTGAVGTNYQTQLFNKNYDALEDLYTLKGDTLRSESSIKGIESSNIKNMPDWDIDIAKKYRAEQGLNLYQATNNKYATSWESLKINKKLVTESGAEINLMPQEKTGFQTSLMETVRREKDIYKFTESGNKVLIDKDIIKEDVWNFDIQPKKTKSEFLKEFETNKNKQNIIYSDLTGLVAITETARDTFGSIWESSKTAFNKFEAKIDSGESIKVNQLFKPKLGFDIGEEEDVFKDRKKDLKQEKDLSIFQEPRKENSIFTDFKLRLETKQINDYWEDYGKDFIRSPKIRLNIDTRTETAQETDLNIISIPVTDSRIGEPETPPQSFKLNIGDSTTARPFILNFPDQKVGAGSEKELYDVEARHKKEWVKVNKQPLPINKALNLGGEVVDNTSSATFRLKKSNKKGEALDDLGFNFNSKFTKKNGVFIENNIFRIDTPGELQGITVKGWLAQRGGLRL